jgi:hypothetical protein
VIEAPKKIVEAVQTAPQSVALKPSLDTYSYTVGFTKGYKEGDAAGVGWAVGFCGVLVIVVAFVALWSHTCRLFEVLERLQAGILEKLNNNTTSLLLPLVLTACLAGCAGKQQDAESMPPVPLPLQTAEQTESPKAESSGQDSAGPESVKPESSKPESSKADGEKASFASPPYKEDAAGQYVTVSVPAELAAGPRRDEPEVLADLLEMRAAGSDKDTAVSLMRPSAIREAAQLVTVQTAVSWRYRQLLAATEQHSAIMDTAFNFSPLLMTHGDALIMPPVLARAGASMRIEKPDTATVAETSYELLSPARYVAAPPNWREYLMVDDFPEPEKPNPAVMPQNDKERAIWRAAVREAWAQGVREADHLYVDNVARMARQYRGVMLYHLLTARHILSRVNTASADLGMKTADNGNKLNIGQRIYRITAPSVFTVTPGARK